MNQSIRKHLESYAAEQRGNNFVYEVNTGDIVRICTFLYEEKSTELKTIFAADQRGEGKGLRIYYVFGLPKENLFLVPYVTLGKQFSFPTLTKHIHEAAGYERKIHTMMGLTPIGHPDLRPFILHENWPKNVFPLRKDTSGTKRPPQASEPYEFSKVGGEGIYEIPVGPVHAGIIEPGHFRFSVAGEEIVLLEPKLGYKHRGVEKLFESLPLPDMVKLAERVSGDTSFTHSLAFCQAIEALTNVRIPKKASFIRVIHSELERLANHLNDIGFIMLDTGYSFGGSSGQRLRESVMQWNERLTGSRYLRGINTIGGVTRNISPGDASALQAFLADLETDFREVISIASESSSVFNRLDGTGTLDMTTARDHGVVGIAARALGITRDARKDYPYAAYADVPFAVSTQTGGDVRARFGVRVKEVYTSIHVITYALNKLDSSKELHAKTGSAVPKSDVGIGIAEGWRGEIVYTVLTDNTGKISRVDVRDPSFLNWPPLGHAGKGNVVPDFPLINKSFNLSYSGHDL